MVARFVSHSQCLPCFLALSSPHASSSLCFCFCFCFSSFFALKFSSIFFTISVLHSSILHLIRPTRMAVEIVQFLMTKYVDALEEDDAAVPFHAHFQEVRVDLEKKLNPSMSLATTDSLRESLYSLNDVLIQCQILSRKRRDGKQQGKRTNCYSIRQSWFLYKTRKRLLTIKQKVRAINSGGGEPYPSSPSHGDMNAVELNNRWTTQAVELSKVHGVSNEVMDMERLLVEQGNCDFKGVGIVGMGGVGKTMLAKVLFNSQKVRRHFFPRIWVCMSQTLGKVKDIRREIIERMLMSLGVDEEVLVSSSNGLAELMFTLHLQLLGKRYLVVFDDLWNIDEWYDGLGSGLPGDDEWADRLAFGLPKGSGGGVIVTSRLEEVAMKMVGEENLHRVHPLTDQESCWAIFMEAFARDGQMQDHPTVRGMKMEILEKCGGLPLAAKTIGEIMCGSLLSSGDSGSIGVTTTSSSDASSADVSGSLE